MPPQLECPKIKDFLLLDTLIAYSIADKVPFHYLIQMEELNLQYFYAQKNLPLLH